MVMSSLCPNLRPDPIWFYSRRRFSAHQNQSAVGNLLIAYQAHDDASVVRAFLDIVTRAALQDE
jgi:hypothetical protein